MCRFPLCMITLHAIRVLAIILLCVVAMPARAAVWYVNDASIVGDSFTSAVGNDANDGLSKATPKRTITAVMALLTPGDTVYIDAGNYYETVVIAVDSVTLIGKDSASTIVDPPGPGTQIGLYGINADTQSGLTIRNLAVTGAYMGIHLYNVDLSTVSGCSSSSNGSYGIYLVVNSDSNTIINNTFNSNLNPGIFLDTHSCNNTLAYNTSSSNTDYGILLYANSNFNTLSFNTTNENANSNGNGGIYLSNSSDNMVNGNTANANANSGIVLAGGSNNTVLNNTARGNRQSAGIYLWLASNTRVEGNTVDSNAQYQIWIEGGSSSDTFVKNDMKASPTNPDSYVYDVSTGTANRFTFTRNFWQTTDSGLIRKRIWPAESRDSILYTPFRLGIVDTAIHADTVAPKAPDTVTAIAVDSTRIRIDWSAVSTSEEAETTAGLNGYRVYRSNQADSTYWELRGGVGSSATTYTDSGLAAGSIYFYRVTAFDNHAPHENEAFYSNFIASAITMNVVPNIWYVNDTSTIGDSYCSAIGNNTNDGLSRATPKRSIDSVAALLTPGDTVYIDVGYYYESVTIRDSFVSLIGADSRLTIIDPPGDYTTDGIYDYGMDSLRVENLAVQGANNGINLRGANYCVIHADSLSYNYTGLELYGSNYASAINNICNNNIKPSAWGHGIDVTASSDNIIRDNQACFNGRRGINVEGSGGRSDRNVIDGNTASSNIGHGIVIGSGNVSAYGADTNTVINNRADSNSSAGIQLYQTIDNTVENNEASGNRHGLDLLDWFGIGCNRRAARTGLGHGARSRADRDARELVSGDNLGRCRTVAQPGRVPDLSGSDLRYIPVGSPRRCRRGHDLLRRLGPCDPADMELSRHRGGCARALYERIVLLGFDRELGNSRHDATVRILPCGARAGT